MNNPPPKCFAVVRLRQDGSPADIAECEQDVAMWAYGTEEVFTASQMREYVLADRRQRATEQPDTQENA